MADSGKVLVVENREMVRQNPFLRRHVLLIADTVLETSRRPPEACPQRDQQTGSEWFRRASFPIDVAGTEMYNLAGDQTQVFLCTANGEFLGGRSGFRAAARCQPDPWRFGSRCGRWP